MNAKYTIRPAKREEAPYIGAAVVDAVGEDIAAELGEGRGGIEAVRALFSELAQRDDSQYSYLNTLVAVDSDDRLVGVCVGYDGARLHRLRQQFIEAARRRLGIEFGDLKDECEATEYYLDSLAVDPGHRGQGIASMLIEATVERACVTGKPAGLLVDKDNLRARRLYERLGFVKVGEREFVGTLMDHLQRS
ncbi:MAG: GNAT family N-acetyltransferase [Duncaniella sp.]|nr:GNAT family N-acetyltransferase [Duncaniella sp.]